MIVGETVGKTAGKIIAAIISTAELLTGSALFDLSSEFANVADAFSVDVSESLVSSAESFAAIAWPMTSSKFCAGVSAFGTTAISAGFVGMAKAVAVAGRSRVFIKTISKLFLFQPAKCGGVFP